MEIDVKNTAIKMFNETWDLIDLPERNDEQKALMLQKAYASRYLWGLVGEPVNFARGEWQISRVHAINKMAEPALLHATLSLDIALNHNLGALDLAFGYEAVARAKALMGKTQEAAEYKQKGLEAAAALEGGDKDYTISELNSIAI